VYVREHIIPLTPGLFIHVSIAACASNKVLPAPTAPEYNTNPLFLIAFNTSNCLGKNSQVGSI